MRMWMVNTKIMCSKHLCGEHVEIHMLIGSLKRNRKLNGFFDNNLLEPISIINRHNDISNEMIFRNFNHRSNIDEQLVKELLSKYNYNNIKIDVDKSLNDLINRCEKCRLLYENL